MKFIIRFLFIMLLAQTTVFAASVSTDAEKQAYSEQVSKWMAASSACEFQLNQVATEVFIVKLIGQMEAPLMTKLQSMATEQVSNIAALSETDKAAECGMIYEQAKPFGIYK